MRTDNRNPASGGSWQRGVSVAALSLAALAATAGTAVAASGTTAPPANAHAHAGMAHRAERAHPSTGGTDASGQHGGTVTRNHSATSCNLPGTSSLTGNWTHGDYVHAAKAANSANVQTAARSACGKPMQASGA